MSKNNLPIKIILQKTDDIFSNSGGGKTKFFSEVTPQLQIDISLKSSVPIIGQFLHKSSGLCDLAIASGLTITLPIAGIFSFSSKTSL